jgi:hypothetical protein
MLASHRRVHVAALVALATFLGPTLTAFAKRPARAAKKGGAAPAEETAAPEPSPSPLAAPTAAPPPPPPPDQAPPPEPPAADAAAPAPPPAPAAAVGGLKIDGTGGASIKLGFLLQPAYEFVNAQPAADPSSQSFFLRRARLLLGVTFGSMIELFADTDAPNLGKATGVGSSVGMVIQDAFGTFKPTDEVKLDMGMMLIPFSHNGLQSAASLYGWDYFAYSFQQSGGLTNFVGRDTGLQLRGLVAKHFEYRLGVFQGRRDIPAAPAPTMMMPMPVTPPPPSRMAVRLAGRVQYNVFDAETAYFYAGTYGGAKKIVSVGAGFDFQDDYRAFAVDGFVDWPLGPDVITAQVNVAHYDGGAWIPVKAQNDIMLEAGYRFGELKVSPILRFENLLMSDSTDASPTVRRIGAGLVYWYMGHNANVKLFLTHVKPDSRIANSYAQLNLQTQIFVF